MEGNKWVSDCNSEVLEYFRLKNSFLSLFQHDLVEHWGIINPNLCGCVHYLLPDQSLA
jgi:hypothetical protein